MTNLAAYLSLLCSLPSNDARASPESNAVQNELTALRKFLYRRALLLTQDSSAAEDLVQAALEKALVALGTFEPGTNLRAWLSRIMRNRFFDDNRHAAVERRLARAFEAEEGQTSPASSPGPADVLDMEDVVACLAELPPRDREVFELFYLRHLSYREIAARQGAPCATIGVRILRSKRRLRAILERAIGGKQAALLGNGPTRPS